MKEEAIHFHLIISGTKKTDDNGDGRISAIAECKAEITNGDLESLLDDVFDKHPTIIPAFLGAAKNYAIKDLIAKGLIEKTE
jgi:hypothetical protein